MTDAAPPPSHPSSSALRGELLAAAREHAIKRLHQARAAGTHDLSDELVETVVRMAMLGLSEAVTESYRAGVGAGWVTACLQLGQLPDGAVPSCRCPACGAGLDAMPATHRAADADPVIPAAPRAVTREFGKP
jgi:hypothetical protein